MSETPVKQEPGGISRLLIDIGPLLVFFVVNFLAPVPGPIKVFVATGAFMAAMMAALVYSAVRFKHISPLLLFSGVMVVVLGGLTIWLHNETFIKVKPTIIYAAFAAVLGFGIATGRPLLRLLLGGAYPALDDAGWRKLTRNWTLFFLAMALLNEAVWRSVSTDTWVQFKVWGVTLLSLLFALAQAPVLMRHGGIQGGIQGGIDRDPPVPPPQG